MIEVFIGVFAALVAHDAFRAGIPRLARAAWARKHYGTMSRVRTFGEHFGIRP